MINKAILIGNVGKDGELKVSQNGNNMLSFSLATTKSWSSNGEKHERTEWHNIVFFGKNAATIQPWVKKGRKVYCEGEIQTRTWDDKTTGQKRYSTQILAENIQFLDRAQDKSPKETESYMPDVSLDDVPF